MTRIEDANPRDRSGSYDRLFGIPALGRLISKVQSAVISSGTGLEKMIADRVMPIKDIDAFLKSDVMQEGVFVARKGAIRNSKVLERSGPEPDFIVFKRRDGVQRCYIVELKDGHVFDTKKATAERQYLHKFVEQNARHMPYKVACRFCAFNQDDPGSIRRGFKNKITLQEAMTGREFCDLLEIDYSQITEERKKDAEANVHYFLSENKRYSRSSEKSLGQGKRGWTARRSSEHTMNLLSGMTQASKLEQERI